MRKSFAGMISGFLAAVTVLSLFSVSAAKFEGAPAIDSASAAVYNLEAEELLYSKNLDGRLDPAAFTKLMTALLAFEYYEQNGNVQITVTPDMLVTKSGNQMRLKEGEVLSFESLLSGLVVQSANDAANAVAVVSSGSVSSFAEKMNAKAKELGMKNSYFSNPTGIDTASMYTTMEDMVILCKALYKINGFMLLAEKGKVTLPATNLSKERNYTNKNALIPYSYVTDYYMKNARGMIAGYTPRAGYCVATVREIKGSKTLVIVSGGVDRSVEKNGTDISSYRDAKALMEWAEKHYGMRQVLGEGEVLCERKLRLASGVDHMILVAGESLEILVPLDADLSKDVTTEVRTEREVFTAPIIEGTSYGEVDVFYQGDLIGTVPLVAKSNIGLSRWLVAWDAVESFFSHGPAKVVLILVIVAVAVYVLALIFAAVVQYLRQNRERNQVIKEMMAAEKRRMKKIRLAERKATQARMRRVRSALRTSYQVLQGETDSTVPAGKGKRAAPAKAVAKVPEKYRSANQHRLTASAPASTRKAPPRKPGGEVYRTGRPARPAPRNHSRIAGNMQDPRRGGSNGNIRKK